MNIKKIIIGFLAAMGIIFILLLLAAVYVYVTDPWKLWSGTGISTTADYTDDMSASGTTDPDSESVTQEKPALTEGQQNALELIGIDPASLPTDVTPAQMECFNTRLGSDRVAEIKAGDTPTAVELFVAKDCLQ